MIDVSILKFLQQYELHARLVAHDIHLWQPDWLHDLLHHSRLLGNQPPRSVQSSSADDDVLSGLFVDHDRVDSLQMQIAPDQVHQPEMLRFPKTFRIPLVYLDSTDSRLF